MGKSVGLSMLFCQSRIFAEIIQKDRPGRYFRCHVTEKCLDDLGDTYFYLEFIFIYMNR